MTADSGDPKLDRRSLLGVGIGAAASAVAPSFAQAAPAGLQPSGIVMLDAVALADAIRSRQISCVEVMTAYLDHIERLNPRVNAIVALQDRAALLPAGREGLGTGQRDSHGHGIANLQGLHSGCGWHHGRATAQSRRGVH